VIDSVNLRSLLASRREGYSLERPFYTDPAFHDLDIDAVFSNEWLFACNVAEIAREGDYITLDIGDTSVVVLRGKHREAARVPVSPVGV
jgi:Rieske 2Fe-2S family protein